MVRIENVQAAIIYCSKLLFGLLAFPFVSNLDRFSCLVVIFFVLFLGPKGEKDRVQGSVLHLTDFPNDFR